MADPEPDPFANFAEFLDGVSQIVEHTSAYRAQCLQAGFSETAAEQMAVQWHAMLLTKMAMI